MSCKKTKRSVAQPNILYVLPNNQLKQLGYIYHAPMDHFTVFEVTVKTCVAADVAPKSDELRKMNPSFKPRLMEAGPVTQAKLKPQRPATNIPGGNASGSAPPSSWSSSSVTDVISEGIHKKINDR